MRRRLQLRVAAVGAVTLAVGLMLEPPAPAQAAPTVTLSSSRVKLGDTLVVALSGWTSGGVTVSLCGNEASRGSVDCALDGGRSGGATSPEETERLAIQVVTPPAPCPCVVRAAARTTSVVQTAPIVLEGVPVAPVVGRPPAAKLAVTATVRGGPRSLAESIRSGLGGRTHRILSVEVRNEGAQPATQLALNAAVGRDAQNGEPLSIPAVEPLRAGETRSYSLFVVLGSPAWGHYVVFGSVYGANSVVPFEARTSTTPGLLAAAAALLVLDLAVMVVCRSRRRPVPEQLGPPRLRPVVALPAPVSRRTMPRRLRRIRPPAIDLRPVPAYALPVESRRAPVAAPQMIRVPGPTRGRSRNGHTAHRRRGTGGQRSPVVRRSQPAGPAPARVRRHRDRPRLRPSTSGSATGVALLVAMLLGAVVVAASRPAGGVDAARPAPPAQADVERHAPGAGGSATSAPTGAGPATTSAPVPPSAATGLSAPSTPPTTGEKAIPVDVTVDGNLGAVDGRPLKIRVTAQPGSQIFGFEAFLCSGTATFRIDGDIRPTIGGNCAAERLSPGSDSYLEVKAAPPNRLAEGTFRAGVGADTFTRRDGTTATVRCGPAHPCQLALKLQYPDGFAFRAFPIHYA